MSIEAMVWALKKAPVTDSGEHLVLISLADHANPEGKDAYPSRSTIAEYARCSVRTVASKLKSLEDAGIILRGDQELVAHIRGDRRPVVYELNYDVQILHPVDSDADDVQIPSHGNDADDVQESAPRQSDDVQIPVATGCEVASNGVKASAHKPSLTVLEPNTLPPNVSTSPALSREENKRLFEIWWDIYPRSEKKAETERLYAEAVKSGVSHETLIEAARGYIRRVKQQQIDPHYVAASVTWLRDQRWLEKYPPAPTKMHPFARPVAE